MIKVMLIDDHKILREGLKQLLNDTSDLMVVAEAGNCGELFENLAVTPCDVVVLDITLPDRSGLEALVQLRGHYPDIPVLILSMHQEGQYAVRAMRCGAAGYLTKDTASDKLVQAIRKVHAGGEFISPYLAQLLFSERANPSGREPHTLLSAREYQVACLIGAGISSLEIAEKLQISVKTIGTYRARILLKMDMKNAAGLVAYFIKNHLAPAPEFPKGGGGRPGA